MIRKVTGLLFLVCLISGLMWGATDGKKYQDPVPMHPDTSAPDAWGYTWVKSTDPGGPTFRWVDITTRGTLVTGLTDDNVVGPFDMLFNFPYYWYTANRFKVGSNGYIQFDNSTVAYSPPFAAFPSTAAPNDLMAICSGDLVLSGQAGAGGQCYRWTNNVDSLVVSFINVTEWESVIVPANVHTFQIILNKADSSITYQYGPQVGRYNTTNNTRLAIGIENATGQIGLQYVYSTTPPHALMPDSGLAIKIKRTVNTGLAVTDAGIVGGLNVTNLGEMTAVGVAKTIQCVVKNFGTAPITNAPVRYAISKTGQPSAFDTVIVASLAPSEQATVTFARQFTPAVTGSYTALFNVTVPSDVGPGNNNKTAEITSSSFTIGQNTVVQYESGVAGGSINWIGGGGVGVAFDLPASAYPVQIESVYVSVASVTAQPMLVQILDGSTGVPGAVLAERTAVTAVVGMNGIDFSSDNIVIPSGRFFVGARGQIAFNYELTAPISYRSWEYTGGWAPYRSGDLQDVIIRSSVKPQAPPTILHANPGPTNNGNNPGTGLFFDLIGGPSPINVTRMRTASAAAAGASFSVDVFTRHGTGLGGPVGSGPGSSSAGWTLLGTVPVVQGPVANDVSEVFDVPTISVAAGDTVGVVLRFAVAGPRYFGTGTPPLETYSDANLTLITGDARSAPFTTTGTFFTSRALVGEIHYSLGVTLSHDLGVSSLTKTFSTHALQANPIISAQQKQARESASSIGDISTAQMAPDALVDYTGFSSLGYSASPGFQTKFALADTVGFRAIVTNYGSSSESSYQLGWKIDAVNQTPINRSTPLASGATDTVLFQWSQAVIGNHTVRAWSILAADGNHGNDTASLNFSVGRVPGDTLYSFNILPTELLLGISELPSHKLVITSGGPSNTSTTDNKYIVTTMHGAILDSTHYQINNTAAQGFGFRDLAWDGRWLLASDNAQVRRIDTATFTETVPAFTAPGTLQRGLAAETRNRIWKSNFTTDAVVRFDSTGVQTKTLGIPTVAPYGIAFDKWTSRTRGYLWYAEPSTAGTIRLSKVDTASGAILTTYNYSGAFPATSSSGGLDIVNDHPEYPGAVVAFMVTQLGPGGIVTAIYLGNDSTIVGVKEEENQTPVAFELAQNYPDPFNPSTTIQFGLPVAANVTLKVFNVLGQEVATLVDGEQSAGTFKTVWNGRNSLGTQVATGVYFYSLVAKSADGKNTFTNIKKMLLVK